MRGYRGADARMKQKKPNRLAAHREFYAKIAAVAGGQLRVNLKRAFEVAPREYFLAMSPTSGGRVIDAAA
jgi:hypothetical protein